MINIYTVGWDADFILCHLFVFTLRVTRFSEIFLYLTKFYGDLIFLKYFLIFSF